MNKHRIFLTMILTISLYCSYFSDRLISQGKWICQNPWPTSADLMSIWPINENKIITTGSVGTVLISNDGGMNWVSKQLPSEYSGQRIFFVDLLNGWILGLNKIFQTEDGGKTWNEMNTNINLSKRIYSNILFIDKKIGYILISPSSTYWQDIIDNPGQLYKTEDGGKTWYKISFDFKGTFRCVSSVDVNNIFVLSEEMISEFERGNFLYITKNGGEAWSRNEVQYGGWGRGILQFITPSIGWIGRYKTTDGGITWKDKFPSLSLSGLNGIYFTDMNNGWSFDDTAVYYSNNGGDDWIRQYSIEINTRSMDIRFFNKNVGWLCGYGGTIYKTNNGGKNWIKITRGTTNTLYDVDFIDQNNGWAVGEYGTILHTENSGNIWKEQSSGVNNTLVSVDFIDKNNGWIAGLNHILNTTDGGKSWTKKYQKEGITSLRDVKFINKNSGFVVGLRGEILRTTNGGESWEIQPIGTSDILADICFIDSLNGWICGSSCTILATMDGGNTWERQNLIGPYFLRHIQFINKYYGWVTSGDENAFGRTTDGGINWIKIPPEQYYLNGIQAFYFVNNNTGWASSFLWSDILKTVNGGQSWIKQERLPAFRIHSFHFKDTKLGWAVGFNGSIYKYDIDSNSLFNYLKEKNVTTNFPNPFNHFTTIYYKLSYNQMIKIIVYNILGEKIETLYNDFSIEGVNIISWDASKYPSGVYFIKIQSKEYIETIKCLLLK